MDAEDNMRVQEDLGADVIMQLDQCPPYPAEKDAVAAAVRRSADWAKRCKDAHVRESRRCSASCRAASSAICAQEASSASAR